MVSAMLDVLTMGRIGVDVYPLQTGVSLREVETFGKYLGGSPTNVAVAAARHGRSAAVITRTGADPFGEFLHDALRRFGVDDRYVSAVPGLPTPVTFCESPVTVTQNTFAARMASRSSSSGRISRSGALGSR